MKNNKIEFDIFGDGMRIFLDYIDRQYRKDANYKPHPIIRAFECALPGIEDCDIGERTMGLSHEGTEDNIYQPYAVVLEKLKDGIEVKEIRNLQVDKELPLDIMIIIFRLQIQLDKIEGEVVTPDEMADALNHVIPGEKFYALGDRWKEARDLFRENLKMGRIRIPKEFEEDGLVDELLSIRYDTPWENYSNRLRALIGSGIIEKLDNDKVQMVITSPKDSEIEKYNVFDYAIEFILGQASDYLRIYGD